MVTGWRGRAPAVLVLWIGCAAIEALLIGKIDPQETPVGIAIAAIAALGAVSALAAAGDRYAPALSALAGLPKLAVSVVRDTFVVSGAVVRALGGRTPDDGLEEIPLDAGGDDARSAAARALAVASASAAPNSIVVDVDRERGVMLVHRLAR
ncbi:MAG: Na+/H+ ion antiporter subunit [Candidatus Eremiobacteraeota bacterium]|jgi:multisubunit Na+/H+ antiporter MnhE subunit|nr:Na+/H+ ion antiporter subunit [Candidatus Eremiobacteraeota bacterium]